LRAGRSLSLQPPHKEQSSGAVSTKKLFQKLGGERIDFLDIEFESPDKLLEYDVLYINGGNPFYLLYWMKKSNAIETIRQMARRDRLIIGTSAGAMVLADSIAHINELKVIAGYNPMDVDGLADYNAVGITEIYIVLHYNRFIDANPEFECKLKQLEERAGLHFERVKDGEAVVIAGEAMKSTCEN
jgi:dipeptidase E